MPGTPSDWVSGERVFAPPRGTVDVDWLVPAVVELVPGTSPARARAALEQQVQRWRGTMARWESEPDTREGRRELMTRAKEVEADRDRAMKEDGRYDAGAALLQVGIVLASAGIITGTIALSWAAGALGLVGAGISAGTFLGWL